MVMVSTFVYGTPKVSFPSSTFSVKGALVGMITKDVISVMISRSREIVSEAFEVPVSEC
jgi:hypothetical protein